MVEKRQGAQDSLPREIGYRNGWLGIEQLVTEAEWLQKTPCRKYLQKIIEAAYQ